MLGGMTPPPPAPKEQPLSEWLAENDPLPDSIEESQTIPAHADPDAAKALRELGQLQRRIEANEATAKAERQKITDWETATNGPLQARAQWLYSLLSKYAVDERNLDEKRKTINTPFGYLKTLPAQDVWEIDEEAFIKWAEKHNPSLVKVTKAPQKAKLKEFYTPTDGKAVDPIEGITVEGVTIKKPERPFTVTIKPS
jgi:Bacteriophage Mu Gam like protein